MTYGDKITAWNTTFRKQRFSTARGPEKQTIYNSFDRNYDFGHHELKWGKCVRTNFVDVHSPRRKHRVRKFLTLL